MRYARLQQWRIQKIEKGVLNITAGGLGDAAPQMLKVLNNFYDFYTRILYF